MVNINSIRHAIVALDRQVDEDEAILVHKAVEIEMEKIKSGEMKVYPMSKVFKDAGLK